ncbi:putative reverse transcriptase domain-containing protein [Tanacetum coccineum]
MPPRMTTRNVGRGGVTPMGERTGTRSGKEAVEELLIMPCSLPLSCKSAIALTTKEIVMTKVERTTVTRKTMREDTSMAILEMVTTTTAMETNARIRNFWHVSQRSLMEKEASLLTEKALTWWNTQVWARRRATTTSMVWDDFTTLLKEEYCTNNEMQKLENELWNHTMVRAGHAAYAYRFCELAKLVPHLVTLEFKRIDRYIFGLVPKIRRMVQATEPSTIQSAILKAEGLTNDAARNGLLKKGNEKRKDGGETTKQEDARVNKKRARTGKGFVAADSSKKEYRAGSCFKGLSGIDKAPGQVQNNLNQVLAIGGNNFNHGNNSNQAWGRAFALVLEDVPFSINLLPFELGSFDVVVGMDWLSKLKAEIFCHERVIRIPLPNGETLEVYGERSEENLKQFASMKADEKKLEDIPIVRDFPKVFPEDLTGLTPLRKTKFHIDLVPEVTPVEKASYRLAPSEMQELSDQLQEL